MLQRFPNSKMPIKKPENLEEMVSIARKLSQNTCFLRVDLYTINGKTLFSEHTFYTDAGYSIFEPESEHWDEKLGEWVDLSTVSRGKVR